MKNLFLSSLVLLVAFTLVPQAYAGDCSTRQNVDWHATIASATHVRVDCDDHKGPVGDSIGVAPAGEVVRIVEVDMNREYFIVETAKGTGFIYVSFLKDIVESPLPRPEPSIFRDLAKDHPYYGAIEDVKNRGIVSGTPEGDIKADEPINRVELAKILVEATTDDDTISRAILGSGIFSDIEAAAWYLRYLKIAHDKGIMTGDKGTGAGPRTVRPGDSANGAEVAKMIAVAFELSIRAAREGEAWYEPYMEALRERNALPYDSPDHVVSRGEMMFMISQILSN